MAKYKGIDTSYGIPINKVLGMLYPEEQRIYNDPFTEKILTGPSKYAIKLLHIPFLHRSLTNFYEKQYAGMLGYFFCRFRYYDDVVKECLQKNEIDVIVNMGAGMDCRPHYIEGIEKLHYYEVDHPTVIENKKERIKKVLGELPDFVAYVGVDFDRQSIEDALQEAGYKLNSKTLFIWESVSAYLTKEANDAIFSFVSKAASGSKFVFSYATMDFMNGKNLNHKTLELLHKRIIVNQELELQHGFEQSEIEEYLQQFSISTIEHIGAKEFKDRYIQPIDLKMDVVEVERLILAEVNTSFQKKF